MDANARPGSVSVAANARHLEQVARRLAADLAQASRDAPRPSRAGRLLRSFVLVWQVVTRKAKTLVREHWDIGLFDVLFGSLKAFAVYPALYFIWRSIELRRAPLFAEGATSGG